MVGVVVHHVGAHAAIVNHLIRSIVIVVDRGILINIGSVILIDPLVLDKSRLLLSVHHLVLDELLV